MAFVAGFILGLICFALSCICFVAFKKRFKNAEDLAARNETALYRDFEEMERQWRELFSYEGKTPLKEEDDFEQ